MNPKDEQLDALVGRLNELSAKYEDAQASLDAAIHALNDLICTEFHKDEIAAVKRDVIACLDSL